MAEVLLVVLKPSGARRRCSCEEVSRVIGAWNSVLDWLQGCDPDELPYSELLDEVARKCALRTPRFSAYDVGLWARQAAGLRHQKWDATDPISLQELSGILLGTLGLQRTSGRACQLNRVAIELLYGTTRMFHRHREGLVFRLLDGPVIIETWVGERKELAQAAKVLIRRSLSASPMSNLIHMEIADDSACQRLVTATEVPFSAP